MLFEEKKKMKIFQRLQILLGVVGIYPQQSSFSMNIIMIVILFGILSISSTTFLLHNAKTINEYSESLYVTTSMYYIFIVTTVFARKIMKLIGDFESVIQKRKCFLLKSYKILINF